MLLIDYAKAIKETGRQLLEKERQPHKAYLRDHMRFLRLLKSRQCLSQKQAGKLIGLSQRSSQRLWKQYCEGGCKALLTYPYQGRPCRLSNEQREQLNNYLAQDQVQFLHEAKAYVRDHFGVGYSIGGVHRLLGRMKVKKKTGRPANYRKDEKGASSFKKSF
jgi:transposase